MLGFSYIRVKKALTFKAIGDVLGKTKSCISVWETRGVIPEKNLEKLAEFLQVPEYYLNKEIDEVDKLKLDLIMNPQKDLQEEIQKEIYFTKIKELLKNEDIEILEKVLKVAEIIKVKG